MPAHHAATKAGAARCSHRQADARGRRRAAARARSPSAQLGRARDSLALHQAERWRAELIADDDALDALARRRIPAADAAAPARLIRNARKDAALRARSSASGRAYRELFQFVREHERRWLSDDDRDDGLDRVRIGLVSVSDRASTGVYEDKGMPALQDWLARALRNPIALGDAPDPRRAGDASAPTLRELVDDARCDLVLTTGGTGPAPRDVTPEATLAVADKEMPGFGEQMRQISLRFVPTAILSRQVAVIRGKALIINLPGQPKAIAETLEGLPRRRRRRCPASSPRCRIAST